MIFLLSVRVKGAHMFTWSSMIGLDWGVGLGTQNSRRDLMVQVETEHKGVIEDNRQMRLTFPINRLVSFQGALSVIAVTTVMCEKCNGSILN